MWATKAYYYFLAGHCFEYPGCPMQTHLRLRRHGDLCETGDRSSMQRRFRGLFRLDPSLGWTLRAGRDHVFRSLSGMRRRLSRRIYRSHWLHRLDRFGGGRKLKIPLMLHYTMLLVVYTKSELNRTLKGSFMSCCSHNESFPISHESYNSSQALHTYEVFSWPNRRRRRKFPSASTVCM